MPEADLPPLPRTVHEAANRLLAIGDQMLASGIPPNAILNVINKELMNWFTRTHPNVAVPLMLHTGESCRYIA
jgi:hypothetical protein